ncbi:MAG: FAD-dependent oxidoreductase, partial [Actinobacteria bacterium]|nr:FAD-dependent oxidoreductase [Actinomycetota bacterium]
TGFSRGDSEEVKRLTAFAQKSSLEMEHVTRLSNSSLFSGISPRFTQGVLFPDDGFVDVEKLVEALLANLQRNGVSIITECVVAIEGGTTAVVRTEKGRYEFDSGILCTGSQKSLVDTAAAKSFRSVRGVTLRLRRRELVPPRMVRALIDGRSIYVVDRPNGEVIIGASSDESDERYVDAQAVADLLRLGIQLCPSLDDAEFLEARSGLRPVGPSGQSFLERLNGSWAWHTGYYRHGVLMAPLAYRRAQEFWND